MSTTTNVIGASVLSAGLVVGATLLVPDGDVAQDGGVVDAGKQQLIGNFYLRFPDRASFDSAAKDAGFWLATQDGGMLQETSFGHNFDVIGIITRPIQDAGPDAGVETLDGWHVNFSGILPESWAQYVVIPKNPVRWMR